MQELIKKRSSALAKARSFFYTHTYLEVDCPILSPYGALDQHIDLFHTDSPIPYYLHSSPEYGMKKLLSQGAPSLFQISHVFRSGESGTRHAQEFSMVEFYKLNISFEEFILETCEFIQLFTGHKPKELITYKEAFLKYLFMNPYKDISQIRALIEKKLSFVTKDLTDDDVLSMAMSSFIEPSFNKDVLTIVTQFPASQAALAESFFNEEKDPVAGRFEIYYQHLELANGYKELKCPNELRDRFDKLNQDRLKLHKQAYPIDQDLLKSMSTYFPDCCGVACGFDRLLMLELQTKNIQDVLLIPSV